MMVVYKLNMTFKVFKHFCDFFGFEKNPDVGIERGKFSHRPKIIFFWKIHATIYLCAKNYDLIICKTLAIVFRKKMLSFKCFFFPARASNNIFTSVKFTNKFWMRRLLGKPLLTDYQNHFRAPISHNLMDFDTLHVIFYIIIWLVKSHIADSVKINWSCWASIRRTGKFVVSAKYMSYWVRYKLFMSAIYI